MIYLDYSATTPVNKEVLDSFNRACLEYVGNPNSLHSLGVKAHELIDGATKQISSILNVKENEIIYTSGASESNNLAIKGICLKYLKRGKHIITTNFEHSSVYGPIGYLQTLGYEVDFVNTDEFGIIDFDHLKSLIREDTILVSITAINSEIGIKEPIEEIGLLLKEYPKLFFHVDATQAIGKIKMSYENVDLISLSAQKFFGLKGVGCLIKKEKILLEPLIHGGKSTTVFRSGTPALPLIVSLAKALRLATLNLDKDYQHVLELNSYLKDNLLKYENVFINSNDKCIPHILNISVISVKPETFLHALEKYEVYISTQTACSDTTGMSKAVYQLTNDEKRAGSSLRISISSMTTKEEIDIFLEVFDKCYKQLNLR